MEVLSPAGNLDILKAVVDAGADAVYFGGDRFGARAYAANFTMEEGAAGIRYAHLHGCKAYLTVNTLLKNREMEEQLYDYLKYYYEAGLDAVIVQDMGVLSFVRTYFPDLALHASTQMSVCTPEGAAFLTDLGVSRIVTAREISLEEIHAIHTACDCEIETFVHGALCVCYSGQCLMSSMLGGRSGNRGRCAQPCRLPYDVFDASGKKVMLPGQYVLSPKDLCTIKDLPQMAEAGVYSLKIEGRMKQAAYATGVVSMYRKYVDRYLEYGKEGYLVSKEDERKLFDLGNRNGFTDVYLRQQNSRDMITMTDGSHRREDKDRQPAEIQDPKTGEDVCHKIPVRGIFTAVSGQPMKLQLFAKDHAITESSCHVPETAQKAAATEEGIAAKLQKTGDTPFVFCDLTIHLDDGLFVPVAWINDLRRQALQHLEDEMTWSVRKDALPFQAVKRPCNHLSGDSLQNHCMVTVETKEQFLSCLKAPFVTEIAIGAELLEEFPFYHGKASETDKKLWILLPSILRQRSKEWLSRDRELLMTNQVQGVIACSYDTLGYLDQMGYPRDRVMLDQRLYTLNDRSVEAFSKMGYPFMTAPYEMKEAELLHRRNDQSYLTIYGRTVLMVMANCLRNQCHGCDRQQTLYYLRDRKNITFPVKNFCKGCYNKIYNSRIFCLFDLSERIRSMGFYGLRLDFTLESGRETDQVLKAYEESFLKGRPLMLTDVTRGHFKRGVE